MQDLAGDTTLGTLTPVQLFAGEAPIVTHNFTAAAALQKYQVFELNASGQAQPLASGKAVGIAAQATGTGVKFPCFEAGAFNHEALVWPGAMTTFDARRAAFAGTDVHIMKLL